MSKPPPTLPKVAFIGTGGTIASLGDSPLTLMDYGGPGKIMQASAIMPCSKLFSLKITTGRSTLNPLCSNACPIRRAAVTACA